MKLSPETILLLLLFCLFLVGALVSEQHRKHRLSLFLLTIGGFFVYFAAAKLCPFLNLWDEQYHALVAKSCMENPFAPMLYEEAIVPDHNYTNWTCAHIWLHKQPLFLWQIALSFKIFGVSELSLRLPSVVMSTLLIPMFYRMAFLLTQRRDTAFFTAMATACSWYLFRLTSGIQGTDHNDVCFIFYISASVWAFFEYVHGQREKIGWALLAGALVGCAVLTKWLVGLLCYLVWGVYLLSEYRLSLKAWKISHLLLALAITVAIALPWQLYILHAFPDVARQEFAYNTLHFNTSVENHGGTVWFYLITLPMHYFGSGNYNQTQHFVWNANTIICYFVLISGFILMVRQLRKNSHRITLSVTILFVFLFFTMAKTKMPAFTFILCFVGFLSIAHLLAFIADKILQLQQQRLARGVLCVGCLLFCVYNVNYPMFYKPLSKKFANISTENKTAFKQWAELPDDYYIFNVKSPDISYFDFTTCIAGTFYSDHQCYCENPSREAIDTLRARGKRIAVVRNPWLIPSLEQDSTILKLELPQIFTVKHLKSSQ